MTLPADASATLRWNGLLVDIWDGRKIGPASEAGLGVSSKKKTKYNI